MTFTKAELLKTIINTYGTMVSNLSLENSVGFFDSNRAVQDFLASIFGVVYGYKNLKDLDIVHETTSFPAVDIGDLDAGVAIQVTSRNDREKITHTLEVFTGDGKTLDSEYSRLIIFILGTKKKYDPFKKYGVLKFDSDKDIVDTEMFIKELQKLSLEQLQEIDQHFEKYLRSIAVNQLYDGDIAQGIDILERDINLLLTTVTDKYVQAHIPNRNSDFMDHKNELNGLDWDAFKAILGHLQHNMKITAFLSNPINEGCLEKYLKLTSTIQNYYTQNRGTIGTIDDLMRYLFNAVNTYDDNFDSRKIQIILHNMYFNCDIGDNPQ